MKFQPNHSIGSLVVKFLPSKQKSRVRFPANATFALSHQPNGLMDARDGHGTSYESDFATVITIQQDFCDVCKCAMKIVKTQCSFVGGSLFQCCAPPQCF